jgi:PilZ domain
MNQFGVRRSNRIEEEIPITLIGSDTEGKLFLEHTHTILISRHGAGVVSKYKLSPEQEILIRLQHSDREEDVRVIGQIGVHSDAFVYGVAFLQSHSNFWGREFAPLTGSESAASSLTLECARCGSRASIEHNDLEADVYAFNERVVRHCKECGSSTVWKVLSTEDKEKLISSRPEQEPGLSVPLPPSLLPVSPPPADSPENRRKDRRTKVKLAACVRRPGFEDDVVICEDMSRGGVRIKSRKVYFADTMIEIAVPYASRGSNIFVPARVLYVQELEKQRFFRCGVAYIKFQKSIPRSG